MPVTLYYLLASPPARAVQLILQALKIPHEIVNVNFAESEHRDEKFLKINPQHTVPVIVDEDGFSVSDSHAINAYLVSKYAEDDKLYPKDIKVRSVVDQRMYFDCGTLFQCVRNLAVAFIWDKTITGMTEAFISRFNDAYESLERFLASSQYIAADHITIADYSILTTIGNAMHFVPVTEDKYPKLAAYIQRGYADIPELENLNKAGLEQVKIYFKNFNYQIP